MFRYNLLCNDCNWEFVGFAVPGTVTTKVKRKQKPLVGEKHYSNEKIDVIERTPAAEKDDDQVSNFEDFTSNSEIKNVGNDFKSNQNKNKVKKRVRVKLT